MLPSAVQQNSMLESWESAATAEVTVKFTQNAMFYRHWTASMNVRNKRVSRCS